MTPSPSRRAAPRGFTLIEMMIVVVIIGVLAAAAFGIARAQARNVQLQQAAGELAMRAIGLRSTALSEGQDYLLVVVDAANNDASQCSWVNSSACARYFVLSAPTAAWTVGAFDPANPGTNANFSEVGFLPRGARLYVAGAYQPPPVPFDTVATFDGRFYGACVSGARCFALRFTMNGVVRAEKPGGGIQTPAAPGFAFVLASDAELERAGGDHRGVVVGFPTGVVKTWPYSP